MSGSASRHCPSYTALDTLGWWLQGPMDILQAMDAYSRKLPHWNTEFSQAAPATYLFIFNMVQMWMFVSVAKWVTLIESGTDITGKQKQLHKLHTLIRQTQRFSGSWHKARFSHQIKLQAWQEGWHQRPCWSQHKSVSMFGQSTNRPA